MAEFKNSGLDSEGRLVLRIPQDDAAKYLAAPQMYGALKEVRDKSIMHGHEDTGYILKISYSSWQDLCQALAKADGKG